jgi:hypothetical protein
MTARPQTAIAAALQRAGLNTASARLYQLAIDALRKGRAAADRGFSIFERGAEDDPDLVREALAEYYQRRDAEMSGAGHVSVDNHLTHADARTAANGSRPQEHSNHMLTARPVREPSAEDRAAASRVANSIALTIFDSFKVRDGRPIGDVRFGELKRMMSANAIEAAVIRQILEHGDAPHDARVRDLLKTEQLQRMIQRAAEIVDAAK